MGKWYGVRSACLCLYISGLPRALLRLVRRRAEQLLQFIQALRQARPFAGERALGASLRTRAGIAGCGLLLRPLDGNRNALGLGAQRDRLDLLLLLPLFGGGFGGQIGAALTGESPLCQGIRRNQVPMSCADKAALTAGSRASASALR